MGFISTHSTIQASRPLLFYSLLFISLLTVTLDAGICRSKTSHQNLTVAAYYPVRIPLTFHSRHD